MEIEKIVTFAGLSIKSRVSLHFPATALKEALHKTFPLYHNLSAVVNHRPGITATQGLKWDEKRNADSKRTGFDKSADRKNDRKSPNEAFWTQAIQVGIRAVESEVTETNKLTE